MLWLFLSKMIDTRKFRYTGKAMSAFKINDILSLEAHDKPLGQEEDPLQDTKLAPSTSPRRMWVQEQWRSHHPQPGKGRHLGTYAMTSSVSLWSANAFNKYQPSAEVLHLVKPFAKEFHDLAEEERKSSFSLHDIDTIELTYQLTLEIGAAILLAADKTDDPVDLTLRLHPSRAGMDDHFKTWGRLLTGLECDPPIVVQFPLYLLMCQAFSFEPISDSSREDYVYSALTGVDWVRVSITWPILDENVIFLYYSLASTNMVSFKARGANEFSDRLEAFQALAQTSTPALHDKVSGEDRCFWRFALAYLRAMNKCENSKQFRTPKTAAIDHGLDHDLVLTARAFDTVGSAYMGRDGAAWLDDQGMDSLLGSGLSNDVMDLHTDIWTGETRNLLRLLYPSGLSIAQALQTMSTLLSGMLCEIYRGHRRARMCDREDGRISSASPPYSFSRARHRRIFETLEMYISHYPLFWEWTWGIYRQAKAQVTEAGLHEPLVRTLKRARTQGQLPESPSTDFFHLWYDMIEGGAAQLAKKQPLGVSDDLAGIVQRMHSLWHEDLLHSSKGAGGWGREHDAKSDRLFSEAGEILGSRGGISEETYKFAIAYGRLSMGLPYIAYHTVDAIIMAFGAIQ